MNRDSLDAEQAYLSVLLEAIQRCVFLIDASRQKLNWPLDASLLEASRKDISLFESLAAINERFAKLQDTLASAMRHAALLAGEPIDSFLKVLSFYEKAKIIKSVTIWQLYRTTRNLAAHDYETDYALIAEHVNALSELLPLLYGDAACFVSYCRSHLNIEPETTEFSKEFAMITQSACQA